MYPIDYHLWVSYKISGTSLTDERLTMENKSPKPNILGKSSQVDNSPILQDNNNQPSRQLDKHDHTQTTTPTICYTHSTRLK